jgi:hypothetical protein
MARIRIYAGAVILLAGCASSSPSASGVATHSSSAAATPLATASASTAATLPAWSRLTPSGRTPSAREDHTWTVTTDAAVAYLFGGRTSDGVALGDLWEYDLALDHWTLVSQTGPPARFGHNAAWVEGVGLVLFAGQAGGTFFNDLWAFDPDTHTWAELPASGAVPVPRYGSCAAIGPDGRLWISHGFTEGGQRFADTRAYDFTTHAWTDETPVADAPIQRCLHGCWWTDDGTFALYAGQTTGTNSLGDLWWLSVGERPGTNVWARQPDAGLPPARNLYAAARLGAGTLVFGGQALDGTALNDVWWLSDADPAVSVQAPEPAPPGRWGAELVIDPSQGRALLFGGRDADGARDDLWQLTVDAGVIAP